MQTCTNVNFVFLGSQESMMMKLFESVRSPFYHFGVLMRLDRIPKVDFLNYLAEGLRKGGDVRAEVHAEGILAVTNCHPYYTQQLAFETWELVAGVSDPPVDPVR